jgi:hypothetical protein
VRSDRSQEIEARRQEERIVSGNQAEAIGDRRRETAEKRERGKGRSGEAEKTLLSYESSLL